MSTLRQKTIGGAFWAFFENVAMRFVSFFVTLVLARLLTPDDYGTVAILAVFISVSETLINCGLGVALVQKKDASDLDFNSVFYASFVLSLVAYGVLFVLAPFVAQVYDVPKLSPLLRTLSVTVVFFAINSVQGAELSRKMKFRESFRVTMISEVSSAVIGIPLAYWGFGAWALVWATLTKSFARVVSMWVVIAWRPKLMFSFRSLKGLLGFGWKIMASSFLSSVYRDLYCLLVGKVYTKADLAYVDKGRSVPSVGMAAISSTIERVTFPALAQLQSNPERVCSAMRKMIQCSTFLVFPLMVGVAVCARDMVIVLFGEKWLPSVPFVQIACFQLALWPFHMINLQVIKALGRSDVFLVLEILKTMVTLAVLAVMLPYGVLAMMLASAFFTGPMSMIINSWPNRKLVGYTIVMQIRDVLPCVLLSLLMGGLLFAVHCALAQFVSDGLPGAVSQMAISAIIGSGCYLGFAVWLRLSPVREYGRVLVEKMNARGNVAWGARLRRLINRD